MKPNAWMLLQRCVEDGLAYGWNRAHKHAKQPTGDAIKSAMEDAVMSEIGEWFLFEEHHE